MRVVSEAVGISGVAVGKSGLPEPAAYYRLNMMVQVSYIITGELSQSK